LVSEASSPPGLGVGEVFQSFVKLTDLALQAVEILGVQAGRFQDAARDVRRFAAERTMPVLVVGAERGGGATLLDTMRLVSADVRGAVFAGCGHYVPEEAPRAVAEQIIRFMGK
jgi:pimeloyl-ACP methyl ester carboxylesterase